MKRVTHEGGTIRVVADWAIDIDDEYRFAMFTFGTVRDENFATDPAGLERLQPLGLTLERMKSLRKDLQAVIETIERGRNRSRQH